MSRIGLSSIQGALLADPILGYQSQLSIYTIPGGGDGQGLSIRTRVSSIPGLKFDDVLVQMYLDSVYESGVDFHFEFYLVKENAIIKKLAYAKHKVVWMKWNRQKPVVTPLPEQLLTALMEKKVHISL